MSSVQDMSTSRSATAVEQRRRGGTPVSHAVLDVLAGWGVRRIYCCPGSTEAVVLDALTTRDDLDLVLVTHESVAVSMAEGEARTTGRPAVAYVHTGVGMANALAHLSSAQLAYAPVVLLNGLKASTLAGRHAFTAVEPHDMVRQHVKWAHVVADASLLPVDVDRALRVATREPAGPVWLGLRQDLLESTVPVDGVRRTPSGSGAPVRPTDDAVLRAAHLLAHAERPVVVAGADVVRRSATDAVLALADHLDAPVLEEGRRDFVASALATGHPRRRGRVDQASDTLGGADVVAYLGTRMFTEFESPDVPGPARGASTIHLHSDPQEVGRLHAVDVELVGDPGPTITAVLDALSALPPRTAPRTSGPLTDLGRPPAARALPGHRDLERVVQALAAAVEATDATVVLDATTATGPLLDGLRTTRPGQLLGSTSGSLGWGMGASLGVAAARPGTPVVCVVGDGAFQFGMPALWVARRLDAPVTFVVLNNAMYAAVASALRRFDGEATARDVWLGTDIAGLDIAGVASAFGLPAQRVADSDAQLSETLAAMIGAAGPALLEVMTGEPVVAR